MLQKQMEKATMVCLDMWNCEIGSLLNYYYYYYFLNAFLKVSKSPTFKLKQTQCRNSGYLPKVNL